MFCFAFGNKGAGMRKPVVIIGAGLAGLSAAWKLKDGFELFEAEDEVGGVARTISHSGFRYDLGPHVLYFKDQGIREWVERILEGRWDSQRRRARVRIENETVDYPIQEGFMASPKLKALFLEDMLESDGKVDGDSTFTKIANAKFGKAMAESFFIPYNSKLFSHPLDEMDSRTANTFLPSFPKEDLHHLSHVAIKRRWLNAKFYYPSKVGIGTLPHSIVNNLGKDIRLSTRIAAINSKEKWVETEKKERVFYSGLITTIPLPEFLSLCVDSPESVRDLRHSLKSSGMILVHFALSNSISDDSHWTYYPSPDLAFHRTSIPANYSKDMAPSNKCGIVTEVAFKSDIIPDFSAILEKTKKDILKIGVIGSFAELFSHDSKILRYAYVFPTKHSEDAKKTIHAHFGKYGIEFAGRYSRWEYGNMESAIVQGFEAATRIRDCD